MGLYETLQYDVLFSKGKFEIRQYKDFLLASTKTNPNKRQDSGFNNVFQYISGNNETSEKISMTTPVVTYEDDETLVTGFYVPSKYSKQNVPKPNGESVFIDEVHESLYAVVKFRGDWSESNYQKHEKLLLEFIQEQEYDVVSKRFVFRYQPPIVPGVFRRNEIAYQVNKKQ